MYFNFRVRFVLLCCYCQRTNSNCFSAALGVLEKDENKEEVVVSSERSNFLFSSARCCFCHPDLRMWEMSLALTWGKTNSRLAHAKPTQINTWQIWSGFEHKTWGTNACHVFIELHLISEVLVFTRLPRVRATFPCPRVPSPHSRSTTVSYSFCTFSTEMTKVFRFGNKISVKTFRFEFRSISAEIVFYMITFFKLFIHI